MSGNPTADNSISAPIDDELDQAAQKLSRSLTGSRRNRLLLLLVASIAIVILTPAALWLSDYFGEVEAQESATITASEMFAAECQLVRATVENLAPDRVPSKRRYVD